MNLTKLSAIVLLVFLMGTTVQAQQSETRTPGSFTSIESGGSWDLIIEKGNKDEIRLESKSFPLDKVITELSGDKLKIKLEKGNHRNVDLTVYVTVRELESIGSSGSGNVLIKSDFNSDKFNIGLSGSGNIKMKKLNTEHLNVGMSGSGNVEIEGGVAATANIGQSGSGDFQALELMAESVKVGKSGSGSTYIGASESLTVGSSGSGNVYYKGSPSNRKISSSGSSKVIQK